MSKDWFKNLPPSTVPDQFEMAIADALQPDKYGPDGWNVTQMIDGSLPLPVSASALNVLIGYDRKLGQQTNTGTGIGVSVTLEVMSRQACHHDAAGNAIIRDSILPDVQAQDGDVIRIEGEYRVPPGHNLTPQDIYMMRARGEDERRSTEYTVRDGKVTVSFLHALDLLYQFGFRLLTAGHKHIVIKPTRAEMELGGLTGERPRSRVITNWLYREVAATAYATATKPVLFPLAVVHDPAPAPVVVDVGCMTATVEAGPDKEFSTDDDTVSIAPKKRRGRKPRRSE